MEKIFRFFPMIGKNFSNGWKIRAGFSNDWKVFFQWLENSPPAAGGPPEAHAHCPPLCDAFHEARNSAA
ncbi:MAG: hypothetical protein IJS32_10475, partial [Kiritimatiellae bacterium]|nr:hypothetical protein [Kiritimatiellia bacterium]